MWQFAMSLRAQEAQLVKSRSETPLFAMKSSGCLRTPRRRSLFSGCPWRLSTSRTKTTQSKSCIVSALFEIALVTMSAHASTPDAVQWLSSAIVDISDGGNAAVCATEEVRNALVAMSKHATTANSVQHLSLAIEKISCGSDAAAKALLGTTTVRDALITMLVHATTPAPVRSLFAAIGNSTCGADAATKALLGATAVRDALIVKSEDATDPQSVRWLSVAIGNAARLDDTAVKTIFGATAMPLSRYVSAPQRQTLFGFFPGRSGILLA